MAVLAVLAVHAWPDLLRGGFVGVDIFFVLSGYLISSIIFRALQAGRFSYADFYARRVRRIFPALGLVLLSCLLFSAVFTFPSQARQIGQHVAAGSVFASNIALWMEAGYFDAASEFKPLLHLWSLGIEEQFYILWPLAAVAVFRWRRHGLVLIGALLLVSFALNVVWVAAKAKGTFFLLPTRAWELMLGAALAQVSVFGSVPLQRGWQALAARRPTLAAQMPDALAWLGVGLIAAAFALLDSSKRFPGWWALLPTLGTLALLAAGPQAAFNRRVLSHRVMVFYGAISYPLYLWHWPLLVFPVLLGAELDNATRVLILAASVGLAALTLEFVERPVRAAPRGPRVPALLCAGMAAIGLGGLALQQSDGLIASYPEGVRNIARAEFSFDYGEYRSARCFLDLEQGPETFKPECWDHPAASGSGILLWGDSHAASLFPGMQMLQVEGHGPRHLAQFTKARCPPVLPPPPQASARCEETNRHVLARIAAAPPDTVLLGGHWSFYVGATEAQTLQLGDLRRTVQALQELGVRRVIVMGHLPTWTAPLPRVLLTAWRQHGAVPERSLSALDPRAAAADRGLRLALQGTGALFVSAMEALCDSAGCLVTQTRQGTAYPMAHDESHLTVDGSAALMRRSRERLFD